MKFTRAKLLEDVFTAYYDARRHKRNTINQLRFEIELEHNLIELTDEVWNRSYKPSKSVCFIVEHPVKREIFAADFRDRVIHHLIFNYINPWFERLFIADCYSCRKGMGTLYGNKRIEHHIRSCTKNFTQPAFVLKLDIAGYFMSIDKNILFAKLERTITTQLTTEELKLADVELVMYLLREVIYDDPTQHCHFKTSRETWVGLPHSKSLFHNPPHCGLPIGNLTSQLFSNIYLTEFDNFVKRVLRVKHYGRYVDDFFVVHTDKMVLIRYIRAIDDYLTRELKLKIHPKKIYLQTVAKGVDFLGAKVKPFRRHLILRTKRVVNRSIRELNAALEVQGEGLPDNGVGGNRLSSKGVSSKGVSRAVLYKTRSSLNSYLGYMRHFDAFKLKRNIVSHCPNFMLHGWFVGPYHKYKLKMSPKTL